jgi:hypothetical protein
VTVGVRRRRSYNRRQSRAKTGGSAQQLRWTAMFGVIVYVSFNDAGDWQNELVG